MFGERDSRSNRHFRIDDELSGPQRKQYMKLVLAPSSTVDSAYAWLQKHGHTQISRSAVARHRRHVLAQEDERRDAVRFALDFKRLADEQGIDSVELLRAMMLRVHCSIFQVLWHNAKKIPISQLGKIGNAIFKLVRAQKALFEAELLQMRWRSKASNENNPDNPAKREARDRAVRMKVSEILGDPRIAEGIDERTIESNERSSTSGI